MISRMSIITLLLVAGSAFGAVEVKWTGKGADDLWTTAENWDSGKVPGPHDIIILNPPPGRGPMIDTDIKCGEMRD